jgi:hypothetical protein
VVVLELAGTSTAKLQASAELVADGELWRLVTSGLLVDGTPLPQIVLTAAAAFAFIRRCGALAWWAVALVGHVGSALLTYAIIGVADALGSDGAEAAADDPDFGISCVLGATLGGLFASGWRVVGAIGFLAMIPFSLDWYGPEHPLSFVIGALVARTRCRRASRPGRPASRRPPGRRRP